VTSTQPYYCNTTLQPPRCVIPANSQIAVGQPCSIGGTTCVTGAYCDTNQPATFGTAGTCRNDYSVSLGGNCSDTNFACANPSNSQCKFNSTSFLYICQTAINSFGQSCNYSNQTADSVQCPSDFTSLYCSCNSTCAYRQTIGGSGSCGSRTYSNLFSQLNNFPSWNAAGYAEAFYGGNQNYLADYYCCQGCGNFPVLYATSTGITIDCQAKTISAVKICDNNYQNVLFLQNCNKYVGATGGASMGTVSFATMAILSSIAVWLAIS